VASTTPVGANASSVLRGQVTAQLRPLWKLDAINTQR
jgi:hypothetical protein